MRFPSGDQAGVPSLRLPLVTCRRLVPSAFSTQMCLFAPIAIAPAIGRPGGRLHLEPRRRELADVAAGGRHDPQVLAAQEQDVSVRAGGGTGRRRDDDKRKQQRATPTSLRPAYPGSWRLMPIELGSVIFFGGARQLPPEPEPSPSASRLAAPGRRPHELLRERARPPVPRHLPAQRPRLLARHGRARGRRLLVRAARRRDPRRPADRPRRRTAHPRGGARPASARVRSPSTRPRTVGGLPAGHDRGRGERGILAEPVDPHLALDPPRAAAMPLSRSSA